MRNVWRKGAPYVSNRCPSVGQPLPRYSQPLTKPWVTVAHALGNRCPMIGQRCPWLGKLCPMLGQRFPNTWATVAQGCATVAQAVGNRCPNIGEICPFVGNRCPSIGQLLVYSSQSRVIAGLCWRPLRPPLSRTQRRECERDAAPQPQCWGSRVPGIGKQSPNYWEAASQHWGTVPQVLGAVSQ